MLSARSSRKTFSVSAVYKWLTGCPTCSAHGTGTGTRASEPSNKCGWHSGHAPGRIRIRNLASGFRHLTSNLIILFLAFMLFPAPQRPRHHHRKPEHQQPAENEIVHGKFVAAVNDRRYRVGFKACQSTAQSKSSPRFASRAA